jgi:hypothetical protein
MKVKLDGREIEVASNIRIGELIEAEKALGFNMDETGSGGRMAISLFVALRREEKEKPIGMLADEVLRVDLSTFEEVAEESPPAEGGDERESADLVKLPTSGPQPSVQSA